jgi:hypothetical protein
MRRLAACTVMLPSLAGCGPDPCPSCDAPEHRGNVANPALSEISGLTASRFPDVYYVHNDSGDTARFFAIGIDGSDIATFEVDGANNDDWEEIARARCASGDCLYIADIGDNELTRDEYAIYVVDEPTSVDPGVHMAHAERVRFTYEDGPHDAEVLLVHPFTGQVTIVTKVEEGPAGIYELEGLVPDADLVAKRSGTLDASKGRNKFTGGAIHPDATGILLRTKTRLFHYPMSPDDTATAALRGESCRLELADEVQGEAVAWLADGSGVMTIGEVANAAVNVSRCGDA